MLVEKFVDIILDKLVDKILLVVKMVEIVVVVTLQSGVINGCVKVLLEVFWYAVSNSRERFFRSCNSQQSKSIMSFGFY